MKRHIVIATLAAIIAALCASPAWAAWNFVHITDIHVDTTNGDVAGVNFDKMMALVRSMNPAPAFVIASGDLVDHGMTGNITIKVDSANWRCLTRRMYKSGNTWYAKYSGGIYSIPIYFTPGNHDNRVDNVPYYPGLSLNGYDQFIGYNSNSKPVSPTGATCTFGTGDASRDYWFTYGNALIVSMYSGTDAGSDPINPSSAGMSATQMAFLSGALKNNSTKNPKIIFIHNPAADANGTNVDGTPVTGKVWSVPDDGCFANRHDWFRALCDSVTNTVVFQGHVEQNVVCNKAGTVVDKNWTGGVRYVQTASCKDGAHRIVNITDANPSFATVSDPLINPNVFVPSVRINTPITGTLAPAFASITVNVGAWDANKISRVEISVNGTLVQTLTSPPYAANVTVPEANQNCVITAKAYDLLGYSNTASAIINGGISTNTYYDRLNVGSSKNINCPKCKGVMTVTFNEIRINPNNQKRQVDLTHSCGCGGWSTLVDVEKAYRLGGGQTGLFVYPARIYDGGGLRCSDIMIAPYQYPTLDIITPMAGQQTNICEVMLATNYSGNDVQWSNAGAAAPVIDGALKLITYTYNGSSASTPNDEFIWNMSSGSDPRTLTVKIKDAFGTEVTKSVSVKYNSSLSYLVYRGEFGDNWTHPTRAEAPSWISFWNLPWYNSYRVNSSFNFWTGTDPYGTHHPGGAEYQSKDALLSYFAYFINYALASDAPSGSLPIIVVNKAQYNSDTLPGSNTPGFSFGPITWKEIYNELGRQMGKDPATGKYRVWASTSAGTRSSADAIDPERPSITFAWPYSGATVTTSPYNCVAEPVTDNVGVTSVKLWNLTPFTYINATKSSTYPNRWYGNVTLVPGSNMLVALAYDVAGNYTMSNVVYVTYTPAKGSEVSETGTSPTTTELLPCAPNPVSRQTALSFQLATPGNVSLKIYNVSGQIVKTLVNEFRPAGYHSIRWDGKDEQGNKVAAGIFLYRLDASDYSSIKKLTVLR